MGYKDRPPGQGGQEQGTQKPGQEDQQQGGRTGQGGTHGPGQGTDKPSLRPTPSGVPNEGRGTDVQHGDVDQGLRTGKGDYEYKGGRQGTGGIPNPDDRDDTESPGSFRGTAGVDDEAQNVSQAHAGAQKHRPRNPK